MTRKRIATHEPELILWPEAALPGFIAEHPEWSSDLRRMAGEARTPILFGTLDASARPATSTTTMPRCSSTRGRLNAQPPYRKQYLVPIVERVPFVNPGWFKNLKYFGGYGRGPEYGAVRLSFGKVGVLICYESIFPQRSREFATQGASTHRQHHQRRVVRRNIAPYQHEAHMALRAIENRVAIVRAANTGISGYIDPLGRNPGRDAARRVRNRRSTTPDDGVTTLTPRIGDWLGTLAHCW